MQTSPQSLALTRPGIIEASAGTGKTFTIAEIYLALLRGEKTYRPGTAADGEISDENFSAPRVREILVVTFTDAATAELRSRLRKKIREAIAENSSDEKIRAALRLADAEFDEASVFTIHGFCLRVLKEFGISARTEEIRASVSDELRRFISRWRARKIAAGESIFFSITADEICKVLYPLLQNPDLVPVEPKPNDSRACALFEAATQALAEWTSLRERARDISYGEILLELRNALRRDPKLAARIAARFRVAVVDEFQDTDPVQWEIFRRIFLVRGKPIFCVGDPKQAIYEFRGGDIRIYRKAKREILAAGNGNALTLGENWRSEPATIDAFNEIFSLDSELPGSLLLGTTKKPKTLSAEISGLLDYSPVAFPQKQIEKIGKEIFDTQRKRIAAYIKIEDEESSKERGKENVLAHVVADIEDLVKRRRVPARKIAVLVSDNKEANRYRAALGAKRVPVSTTARGNVLCEPIAHALADVLRAMAEPQDSSLFRRALISPFFSGVGEKIIFEPVDAELHNSVRQAFADARTRWEKSGFLSAFRKLGDTLCFSSALAKQKSAQAVATHVLHLTEILHRIEQKSSLSPRALTRTFDELLAAADPADEAEEFQLRADSDADAVRILTVHKSKGLEFDIVFVPSLWAKSLYSKRSDAGFAKGTNADGNAALFFDSGKEKTDAFLAAAVETASANAACLFYVALTRARSRLVVYHVPQAPLREIWNSYQHRIFDAALPAIAERGADSAWKILSAKDALPLSAFPKNEAENNVSEKRDTDEILTSGEAKKRFAVADAVRQKLASENESVFSFSKIIHASEKENAGILRDDDESREHGGNAETGEIVVRETAGTVLEKTEFADLPVGAEFGTLAHFIFEKTNFRTRENLGELADAALRNLRNWQNSTPEDRAKTREKLCAMVRQNLALRLFPASDFRLEELAENDSVHEMEFHFPLKRSRNLYAQLFRLFKKWGGIYAETADFHWSSGGNAAATPLNIAGMMTGIIDLVFRADGKYFILDWKTNVVAPTGVPENFRISAVDLHREIVAHGYALQWTLYALALRNFLRKSLGENYVHARDFGGIVYLFVRWCAPFVDTETLTEARLDELAKILLPEEFCE